MGQFRDSGHWCEWSSSRPTTCCMGALINLRWYGTVHGSCQWTLRSHIVNGKSCGAWRGRVNRNLVSAADWFLYRLFGIISAVIKVCELPGNASSWIGTAGAFFCRAHDSWTWKLCLAIVINICLVSNLIWFESWWARLWKFCWSKMMTCAGWPLRKANRSAATSSSWPWASCRRAYCTWSWKPDIVSSPWTSVIIWRFNVIGRAIPANLWYTSVPSHWSLDLVDLNGLESPYAREWFPSGEAEPCCKANRSGEKPCLSGQECCHRKYSITPWKTWLRLYYGIS